MCCCKLSRLISLVLNLTLFISSMVMLTAAFAIIYKSEPDQAAEGIKEIGIASSQQLIIPLLFVGGLYATISLIGVIGVIVNSGCVLRFHSTILVVLIAFQSTGIIVGLTQRDRLARSCSAYIEEIEKSLINPFKKKNNWTKAIESSFNCCIGSLGLNICLPPKVESCRIVVPRFVQEQMPVMVIAGVVLVAAEAIMICLSLRIARKNNYNRIAEP
ncbi:hypothetical protein ACOME3_007948 [Neoechinorhynchus agilis]